MPDFQVPEFLRETEDDIHRRMISQAPPDIDVTEGSIFWNATRPTAVEKAEMIQMKLIETVKLAFPQWSYGIFLELLGEAKGLKKHEPTKAVGEGFVFTGLPGTPVPKGSIVATVSDGTAPSVEFETLADVVVGEDGRAVVDIRALEPGIIGNVPRNAIQVLMKPIDGITSITNPNETTGGAEEEDEEAFRVRVVEAFENVPLSGARSDYIRWAKEIDGVGQAFVIPEWKGPETGTVKVLILDSNFQPANHTLIDAVQLHIAPDGRLGGGLAPIGAEVTVAAPRLRAINISFSGTLKPGYSRDEAVQLLGEAFAAYFLSLAAAAFLNNDLPQIKISFAQIGGLITRVPAIDDYDYDSLLVNGQKENITLESDEIPTLGVVELL